MISKYSYDFLVDTNVQSYKIFVIADEFCKVFNAMLRRRGISKIRTDRKRNIIEIAVCRKRRSLLS